MATYMLPTLLCDPKRTVPQQGMHTRGVDPSLLPWLGQLFMPRRGGLQSLNKTITPTGTTIIRARMQTFTVSN
jgi:hypothetical protein